MTRIAVWVGLSLGCNPGVGFSGSLVDGISGQPRGDVRVVAKAVPSATDLTCQARETQAGPDGTFVFADLCKETTYDLSLGPASLFLAGASGIEGGKTMNEPSSLTVWRAPPGHGVFKLSGDKLTRINTFTDVHSELALGGKETVLYPYLKPTGKVPTIAKGEYLVISGKRYTSRLEFAPIIEDKGRRRFKGGSISNHVYIGVQFQSDTKLTRVDANLDKSKLKDVMQGKRAIRYVPGSALAAGRYSLMGEGDGRLYIFDFTG